MLLVKNYWSKKYSYELLSTQHPYKKDTLEAVLIEYVISNISLLQKRESEHNKSILQLLKKRKIQVHMDLFIYESFFTRAIWLARFNGIIRIKINEVSHQQPRFAIYLESGLTNLINNPECTTAIDSLHDNTRKDAFYEVLYIADEIYKKMQIPQLMESKINNEIILKNISTDLFEKIHSLPVGGWYSPGTSIDLNTRGIVHHLGDEMAFICAAAQYGELYIVGHDEMGDMVVLAKTPDSISISVGQSANMKDFDYIYGTPKGDSLYPSNFMISLNYTNDTPTCKINDADNMSFSNKYWENDVFIKYAKRTINTYSLKELTAYFMEKFNEVIHQEKFLEHKEVYQKTYEQRCKLLKHYKDYLNAIESVNKVEIYYSEDNFSIKENDIIFENEGDFASDTHIKKIIYYPVSLRLFTEQGHPTNTNNLLLESAISYSIKNNNPELLNNVKEISKIIKKIKLIEKKVNALIKQVSVQYTSKLLNEDLINEIYKSSQLFYKTCIPFLYCDVVNAIDKNSGFFLKEGLYAKSNATYINYAKFLHDLTTNTDLSINNIDSKKNIKIEDIFEDYILKTLIERHDAKENYKQILLFNHENNLKSFVVSEVIDMQNEYRIFIINNRAVSGSPCYRDTTPFNAWQKGRFDPRLCIGHNARTLQLNKETRQRVAMYAKFVRNFTRDIKNNYPHIKNYVLDVAWSDTKNEVVAIEINDITFSGAYQINMNRVCAAVAEKKFNYEDMDKKKDFSFHLLKEHANKRNQKREK